MLPFSAVLSLTTLGGGAAILALLYAGWYLYANLRYSGEPPVISGLIPFLGVAIEFGKDSVSFLRKCQRDHGDVFTLIIAGKRMTFIMDPDDIPRVFREKKRLTFNDIGHEVGKQAFMYNEKGLAEPSMDKWVHQWYQIGLQRSENLTELTSRTKKHLLSEISAALRVQKGQTSPALDLWAFVSEVVFKATTMSFFGDTGLDHDQLREDFEKFDEAFPLLAGGVPSIVAPTAVKALDRLAGQMMSQARRKAQASALINAREERFQESKLMTDDDKSRTHVSLLWAMQGNTLPASFWSLAFIYQDKKIVDILREEITNVIRSKDGSSSWKLGDSVPDLTCEDLNAMFRTESSIMEALRMRSSSLSIRRVKENMSLKLSSGIFAVRKGDTIVIASQALHQDIEIHSKPANFLWNRFLEESEDKEGVPSMKKSFQKGEKSLPLSGAYMPFGGGVSMCPGRFFAINEIKIFTVLMLCGYDLKIDLAPPADLSRAGFGILHPASACKMQATKL